jgi:polyisoprenyl-teichoic acid--peptidoglycan teichoic acid transferase
VPTYTRYTAAGAPARHDGLWLRVTKIFVVGVVCFVAVTAGALFGWLQRTAAQVARNDPQEVQAAKPQLTQASSGKPLNILVLGSDRRVGQPSLGARSDTLLLVRLDPRSGSISMLSVPRDLLVDIPGYGQNKINAAYSFGGARLALEVTKRLLGLPINDFVDINFDGFKQVINKLGGAYLMIDRGYYNNTTVTGYASIDVSPGYQRLNGAQALDWVRYRHDQNGDFTRIVRQQIFLREMKRELAGSATLTSLPRFLSAMTIISRNVTSDISSLSKLYSVLSLALSLNTNHIYQTHIDGSTPTINGIDYVVATPAQVHAAVRQFLHPAKAPHRAASVAGASGASPRARPSSAASLAPKAKRAITDSAYHVAQWRALQAHAHLKLYMPAALPGGLGYDQYRAYSVPTGSSHARAAVVVGTAPQGGFWDVQAIAWTGAPILASPDSTRTIAGRSYSLYYDGSHLHMIAWRVGGVAYWISNTLDDELSNHQMLALATSSVRVP